ncbi:MAG: threonine--tRNA ligase [Candidatus Moranbacteria bacterium RIFOXYA12_FULL_35_19]|nr:MAG: Threonine-tRNA ligase [Candidatus Moranbacteria bacterium GW2011_GWF2_35_39]OGI31914.1 MAG: threonine--tRNA ligase [Candidatus Moranbacteria bacterium RIFOXYB12_FULL_35_8]OGI35722.1 MAG: threonine--tRNA ligase [Candidatus Moranbacteria bacterium RIFOXYA12_FULL_35_19]
MPKKSQTNLDILRHSTSHVLASAVLQMFPEAKFAIGPAIENGFYYDFDLPRTLIPEDLEILEEKMKAIIKANHPFEKAEISIEEALKDFKKAKQPYKVELIKDLEKKSASSADKMVSVYKSGNFIDLCSGPHLDSTGEIPFDAFKLTKISGAYWRGDEKNKMLQRIYGVAFETKKELDEYLHMLEEAEKRDHRKLGKELDLFCFSDLVGPGLPLFTPKGTTIIEELKKEVEKICRHYGFEKVSAPALAKIELFETSGHAKKFGDELFHVTSDKKHNFVLKPVQCPHHTQLYASKTRSYKDLPIRYMESDKMYRAEKTGEVGGLSRVYAITVEDGHSFCRVDQVKNEIKNMVNIIKDLYSSIGLWDNHWVSLSVRDYDHPEKYIGESSDWDICEKMLQEISDEIKLDAQKREGEAALYGPKLDFMFKDATGREIQIPTVQIDFATPKRFGLEYINEKGEKVPPVMVHRAILGSYERFLVLLIEHFAGAFPLWLSPVQVAILPVSEKFNSYAQKIYSQLLENNIRVEISDESESLGKRIREAEKQKIPYMLVVGEKEEADNSVAVRSRKEKEPADAKAMAGKQEVMKVEKFIEKVIAEIK